MQVRRASGVGIFDMMVVEEQDASQVASYDGVSTSK
jgi:hypothetical protein